MSNIPGNRLTIEWAPFKLAEGVDEATLLDASEAVQSQFISQQGGFIRRDVVKVDDNQWVDIIYWSSLGEAEQAAKNAATSPICLKYFELMVIEDPNDPSNGMAHYEVVKSYQ